MTNLVASGVSVKFAQTLARHSTPTLTIGRYAHAAQSDLSTALEGLPILVNPTVGLTSQIDAMGTALGKPINVLLGAPLTCAGSVTSKPPPSTGEITPPALDISDDPNSMPLSDFGEM